MNEIRSPVLGTNEAFLLHVHLLLPLALWKFLMFPYDSIRATS